MGVGPNPRSLGGVLSIALICSQSHYLPHLLAVYQQFRPTERAGINPHTSTETYRRAAPRDVALCAGWVDARVARRLRYSKVVLMEHGCGQSYLGDSDGRRGNPHYVGGAERTQILDLVLLPNRMAADVERRFNPELPVVVVGSPWLDTQRVSDSGEQPSRVSVAFHWDCPEGIAPEAGSVFREYREAVAQLPGVLTHTHPRAPEHQNWYLERGLPWCRDINTAINASPVFVSDNSSALYYAAALGRNVVVANSRGWRMDVEHGLRFWSHAAIGEQIWYPEDLVGAVERAESWRRDNEPQRDKILAEVFPYRGESAVRAADVLRSFSALWGFQTG